ncbi:hypothetical protein [Vibrio mangrovi]|nr:hypothetical protein [Vibrio mangrovi]MDW6003251.1 hypothetical protein [Vibrio mangrovi]
MNKFDFMVNGAEISSPSPAIYCLVSMNPRCIYIGQTNSKLGVLGRFSQHLSETSSNTFKQRIRTLFNYDEYTYDSIHGTYFSLPNRECFTSSASDYREAIEGLVQSELISIAAQKKFIVVSRVSKNRLCEQSEIKTLSQAVVEKFGKFLRCF